jgi:hypothetical protein
LSSSKPYQYEQPPLPASVLEEEDPDDFSSADLPGMGAAPRPFSRRPGTPMHSALPVMSFPDPNAATVAPSFHRRPQTNYHQRQQQHGSPSHQVQGHQVGADVNLPFTPPFVINSKSSQRRFLPPPLHKDDNFYQIFQNNRVCH